MLTRRPIAMRPPCFNPPPDVGGTGALPDACVAFTKLSDLAGAAAAADALTTKAAASNILISIAVSSTNQEALTYPSESIISGSCASLWQMARTCASVHGVGRQLNSARACNRESVGLVVDALPVRWRTAAFYSNLKGCRLLSLRLLTLPGPVFADAG
jgi:hypothetical protein